MIIPMQGEGMSRSDGYGDWRQQKECSPFADG